MWCLVIGMKKVIKESGHQNNINISPQIRETKKIIYFSKSNLHLIHGKQGLFEKYVHILRLMIDCFIIKYPLY